MEQQPRSGQSPANKRGANGNGNGKGTLRPSADAKSVEVTAALAREETFVLGDPHRLQQAVSNILVNALKFTPSGGRIELRLARRGRDVELEIADDGDGIRPEFLPLVFERFRQADSTSQRRHGGLGIGLAVVRPIIELHGGSVTAHSEGEGRGATFRIRLPAAGDALDAESAESPAPVPPSSRPVRVEAPPCAARSLEGIRVLLVEDNEDTRELIAEALRQERAEVTAVGSAREALAALREHRPDVVVSDVAMPGEDGYELLRSIRRSAPEHGGTVPALALTAYAREEDRARAFEAGFQMHAVKPIEPAVLVGAIAKLARGAEIGRDRAERRALAPQSGE